MKEIIMIKAGKETNKKPNLKAKMSQTNGTKSKVLFKTSFVESWINPFLSNVLTTILVVGRVLYWLLLITLLLFFKMKLTQGVGLYLVGYLLNRFK